MKNITTHLNLKELAPQLSMYDIAKLILIKANKNNSNLHTDIEFLNKFNINSKMLMEDLNRIFETEKKGFIFKNSLSNDFIELNKNINFLINLIDETDGIKLCYVNLDFYALEHLTTAKLLRVDGTDQTKKVFATDELKNLIKPLGNEKGCYDFALVNDILISYLSKTLHNQIIDVEMEDR